MTTAAAKYPDLWKEAQRLYENEGLSDNAIAKRINRSPAAVWQHRTKEGWKRHNRKKGDPRPPEVPFHMKPVVEEPEPPQAPRDGKVQCPECGELTLVNPCEACGTDSLALKSRLLAMHRLDNPDEVTHGTKRKGHGKRIDEI